MKKKSRTDEPCDLQGRVCYVSASTAAPPSRVSLLMTATPLLVMKVVRSFGYFAGDDEQSNDHQ